MPYCNLGNISARVRIRYTFAVPTHRLIRYLRRNPASPGEEKSVPFDEWASRYLTWYEPVHADWEMSIASHGSRVVSVHLPIPHSSMTPAEWLSSLELSEPLITIRDLDRSLPCFFVTDFGRPLGGMIATYRSKV